MVWPPPATKDQAVALSPLPPHWGGEENGRKKAKLLGRDKDNLPEQQRKRTVTTILTRRIYKIKRIHRATLSLPYAQCNPELQFTSPQPASPLRPKHDITWYWILCLASLGQPSPLCPLPASCENDPIPAEPRTTLHNLSIIPPFKWREHFFILLTLKIFS